MKIMNWEKQILKSVFLSAFSMTFVGCMVVSNSTVRKQVAADKNCPVDQVKIKDRTRIDGRCNFEVEACGKNYTYQSAPVVFEKGDEPHGLSD